MKSFIVFALLAAAAVAAPPQYPSDEKNAEISEYFNDNIGVGPYKYLLKTSNGIQTEAEGTLQKVGNEGDVANVVRGSYSYTGTDGVVYTVNYVADENGYRAEGAHIPK